MSTGNFYLSVKNKIEGFGKPLELFFDHFPFTKQKKTIELHEKCNKNRKKFILFDFFYVFFFFFKLIRNFLDPMTENPLYVCVRSQSREIGVDIANVQQGGIFRRHNWWNLKWKLGLFTSVRSSTKTLAYRCIMSLAPAFLGEQTFMVIISLRSNVDCLIVRHEVTKRKY